MTTQEEIHKTERVEYMQEQAGHCKHNYVDDIMPENGVDYPIKRCTKCGDWS